jgi:hypothetical protein
MRPLVFIGHCFGGLVIQKVILIFLRVSSNWDNFDLD